MLQYLVKSKARRRLLALLWQEEAQGSTSQLADAAGVSFAAAHRELREMQQYGLVRVHSDGRRDVYRANVAHPEASVLRELLRATHERVAQPEVDGNDDTVRAWLKQVGVPLRVPDTDVVRPSLPEVLLEGVRLARRDPTVARALPVGFWQLRDQLDVHEMADLVTRPEEKHAVGFFLELAGDLGGDRRLGGLSEMFRDHRMTAEREFFLLPPTSARRELSDSRTPTLARKWGFRMNLDHEAFESLFRKFKGRS